jgi:glycosyltransferase involved in cell wall biosynthesis
MANRLKPDVQIFNLEFPEGRAFFRFLSMSKFFKTQKPDVVHTHAWGACSFDGILGAKLAKVPTVINGEHGAFFLKKYQIVGQRFLAMLCDATLSVSEFLKQEIERHLGISRDRIMVISNGVDTDIFNGSYELKQDILELLKGENGQRVIVGCIGSLKPIKNQLMLLKALKLMFEENPAAKVVAFIVGDGPDTRMLNDYVKENKLNNHVFFLGRREDIPELLSMIDIVVSTSRTEGAPNVLLEAMASGIPVVATNSGGANEYLIDGENGYLVEQDDIQGLKEKIQLLLNEDRRKIMGEFVREFVFKNYSIKKMVLEYENLYLDLYAEKFKINL